MRILALSILLAAPCIAPARAAEVACGPLASITKQLAAGKYHESPIAHAIGGSGVMLIVFAAADGATWTMIGVKPDHPGIGCILAVGTDWLVAKARPAGKPS